MHAASGAAAAAGQGCSGLIPCGGSRSCRSNSGGLLGSSCGMRVLALSLSVTSLILGVTPLSVSATSSTDPAARSWRRCSRHGAVGPSLPPPGPVRRWQDSGPIPAPPFKLSRFVPPSPPSHKHTIARSHRGRRRLRCRHHDTAGPGAGAGGWGAGVPAHKLVSAAHPCV